MSNRNAHLESQLESYSAGARTSTQPAAWSAHLNRWPVYAAATGAALAMATSADASIISGDVNYTVTITRNNATNHRNSNILLTTGVELEMHLVFATTFQSFDQHEEFGQARLLGLDGASLFVSGTEKSVAPLAQGEAIEAGLVHRSFSGILRQQTAGVFGGVSATGQFGQFPASQSAIAGFQLSGGDLGWIDIKWSSSYTDGYPDHVYFGDWAVNQTAGQGILAGEDTAAVPEPGTGLLSLLALGAAGIVAWRKSRAQAFKG